MSDEPEPTNLDAAADEDRAELATIDLALEQARQNLAHLLYVTDTDEEQAVVDRWTDITYRDLRAALTDDQLARAVLTLVRDDAWRLAQNLFRHSRRLTDAEVRYASDLWAEQGYGSDG